MSSARARRDASRARAARALPVPAQPPPRWLPSRLRRGPSYRTPGAEAIGSGQGVHSRSRVPRSGIWTVFKEVLAAQLGSATA